MKRLLIAVFTLVSAQAFAGNDYALKYSVFDFQSVETVKALHRRIVNTAKRTCPSYSEVRSVRVVRECKQGVVDDLVGKIDRASLSAYFEGDSEIRIAELLEHHRGNT